MENQESIRVSLGDWRFNSGVVGLVNILGKENVNFIDNQTVEISLALLENFEDKYFDYFIVTYNNSSIVKWSFRNKYIS